MNQVVNLHTFDFLWLKVTHTSLSRDRRGVIASVLVFFLSFFFSYLSLVNFQQARKLWILHRAALCESGLFCPPEKELGLKNQVAPVSCPTENTVPIIKQRKEAAVRSSAPNRIRALYRNSHELRLFILFYQSAYMSYFRKNKTVIYRRESICILSVLIKS